jgi:hypothetical protein
MSRIRIRHINNKAINFVHVINFLVGYRIMTFEEAHSLYERFKLGEDIVFDIPDEMDSKFRSELDSLNCKHE